MKKVKKYTISEAYSLRTFEDTETGSVFFHVVMDDLDKPSIRVDSDFDDPTVYMMKVQPSGEGELDLLHLDSYLTDLEEAWEAADMIREIIMQNFPVKVS